MNYQEVNFDGLVGPTHNYSGLSHGNLASFDNKGHVSHPKSAVLQGLKKMKSLHDMGLPQAIIAPHERPNISLLRNFGFSGKEDEIIEKVYKVDPTLLAIATSASPMWTANAATVSPSPDTKDGKVHISVANLNSLPHRFQESEQTQRILTAIFNDEKYFTIHSAIQGGNAFGDEGAANHTRLCLDYGQKGKEVFVFGKYALDISKPRPRGLPARQTFEASNTLIRRHNLKKDVAILVQQSPEVINKGVFHNDVISVGNKNVLLYHEDAFIEGDHHIENLKKSFDEFIPIKILNKKVSVEDAVRSYLFNTQLVSLKDGSMSIIAPKECEENSAVRKQITEIIKDQSNPIKGVHFFDLRESMQNGGGPACLRLRVVLSDEELQAINQGVLFSDELYETLVSWANKHYRDKIRPSDIKDPNLLKECRQALDELTKILKLGNIYEFQR